MNSIEEKLWNYIDGTCTPDEQQAIARLIETDEVYRRKYEELSALNAEFATMEFDEPSMAFTYNVMEQIGAENAQTPLKARINPWIIKGIAAFFILTITALIIVALSAVNWSAGGSGSTSWQMPDLKNMLPASVVQAFLFFDVVLGLYLFDAWLRRKKVQHAL